MLPNFTLRLSNFLTLFRELIASRAGSILPISALLMPVLVLTAAASFEYSRVSSTASKMQSVVDAALMAAAIHVDGLELGPDDAQRIEQELNDTFYAFMDANMRTTSADDMQVNRLEYDAETGSVVATVDFDMAFAFYPIDQITKRNYSVESSVGLRSRTSTPLSMMFVLDKSGSMWGSRIAALKVAVNSLTDSLTAADPETKFVRTGISFYDSSRRTSRSPEWGVNNVRTITAATRAGGGTNSSKSMSWALNQLRGNREEMQHSSRNSGQPRKVILFLTDGANNRTRYDRQTINTCNRARNENIDVYTVAFQAPSRGRALLQACATSPQHYFDANSSAELVAVFSEIGQIESGALVFNR